MDSNIKLLVVDDHPLFRRGLISLLSTKGNLSVVGEASNGEEAIRKATDLTPDVILMDIQMPKCTGIEATCSIRGRGFSGGILLLTVSDRDEDFFAALKAGGDGYLLKNAEPEEITLAISHVARREAIISPVMATRLLTELRPDGDKKAKRLAGETDLSPREEEILGLVAAGSTNKEVGAELFITENTVKTHLRRIMQKLHLRSRYEAVAYATKKQLLSD